MGMIVRCFCANNLYDQSFNSTVNTVILPKFYVTGHFDFAITKLTARYLCLYRSCCTLYLGIQLILGQILFSVFERIAMHHHP